MKKITKPQAKEELNLLVEKKSVFRFFLLVGFLLILANSILFKPISIFVNADYLLKQGILPYLLELIVLICDVLFYTAAFSTLAYSLCFFQTARYVSLCYVLLYAMGKLLDVAATWIINKYIYPILWFETGIYFLISLAFLGIFYIIISIRMKRYHTVQKELIKAKAVLGQKSHPAPDKLYPFERLLCTKNPLQWCALIISILLSVPFMVPKLIEIFLALPVMSELFKAVALFLAYALLAVISYLASLLLFSYFFKVKERTRTDLDSVLQDT